MISKPYTIPHTVMMQSVDDETLLFDSATELFFSLNDTGAMMWEVMADHNDLANVHAELVEAFDVDPSVIENDLITFAGLLAEQSLVILNGQLD